jgi:hypothetical protein
MDLSEKRRMKRTGNESELWSVDPQRASSQGATRGMPEAVETFRGWEYLCGNVVRASIIMGVAPSWTRVVRRIHTWNTTDLISATALFHP